MDTNIARRRALDAARGGPVPMGQARRGTPTGGFAPAGPARRGTPTGGFAPAGPARRGVPGQPGGAVEKDRVVGYRTRSNRPKRKRSTPRVPRFQ